VGGGCRYELSLSAEPRFTFRRYDSLPAAVAPAARREDLAGVDPRSAEALPGWPKAGDILLHIDGEQFRVVGRPPNRLGLELIGVASLTLYSQGPARQRVVG
jgi:hypothetical protein